MKIHSLDFDDFVANIIDNNLFCANLQNIQVSLMFRRWFVDGSLERHNWSLDNFDGNFLIFFVCVLLTSESLMFHCFFIDDSLMTLWRNIDVTAKISMQALLIFMVFFDLISKTLMLPCCFIVGSLMILWRDLFETLIISMETFSICIVFVVLTSESLLFHCYFRGDSLMTL